MEPYANVAEPEEYAVGWSWIEGRSPRGAAVAVADLLGVEKLYLQPLVGGVEAQEHIAVDLHIAEYLPLAAAGDR
jgi:hypothetical protein